ncbi:hypothetical protein SUGI_0180900 [Cryptomeria japonica]|nr:hypothetical protein SUGI_0180900 [Cryptomeria japonica]
MVCLLIEMLAVSACRGDAKEIEAAATTHQLIFKQIISAGVGLCSRAETAKVKFSEVRLECVDHDNSITPLQKHVALFDRNKDKIVYPWEAYKVQSLGLFWFFK